MTEEAECILSIDAMGGDTAPQMVIDGLAISTIRHPKVRFLLHGDEARIAPLVARHPVLKSRSETRHVAEMVAMDEKPSAALRRKDVTSMWRSIASVKDGEAKAIVSAGNTGALMAMARMILKPMPGIDRPAIAALWPNPRGESVVLDVGANIGPDERQLVDFAILGEAYARVIMGLERPSVAILNIGAEEVKGNEAVKAAAADIRASGIDMNFYGFVEGDDISLGTVDVVVTDGYTGNVALKTAEGAAKLISNYLSNAIRRSLFARIGYVFASGAFKTLREKMDPRSLNGGVFLGLNGVVVKSHGGTDGLGYASAVDLAIDVAKSDIASKIQSRLNEIKSHRPLTALERMQAEQGAVAAVGP
ncbi:MAG: phosphate acyltransferase PlsX [Alphaproteobacteria bacterium]